MSRQCVQCSPSAMMFTSLSTSTGRVVVLREPARDREAVPAGHDRRRDRLTARERDRAGDADADAADVVRRGDRSRRAAPSKRSCTAASTISGTVGDVHVERRLGERRAREVGHDQAGVGGAEVGDQDDSRALVEHQHRRRAPTGGGACRPLRRPARARAARRAAAPPSSVPNRSGAPGRRASPPRRSGSAAAVNPRPSNRQPLNASAIRRQLTRAVAADCAPVLDQSLRAFDSRANRFVHLPNGIKPA